MTEPSLRGTALARTPLAKIAVAKSVKRIVTANKVDFR